MATDNLTVYVTTRTKGWWRVVLLCWWIKLWKLQENVIVTVETRPQRSRRLQLRAWLHRMQYRGHF